MTAWHAYIIDYNIYKLAEYANTDADVHSHDRGLHDRDNAVGARITAVLLANSTWTA